MTSRNPDRLSSLPRLHLQGLLQRALDLAHQADPDRAFHRALLFLLAPLLSACGGGGGGGGGVGERPPTTAIPKETLTPTEPDYIQPDSTQAVAVDGHDGPNVIATGSGNDVIAAAAGPDLINPGAGQDAVDAGEGDDTIVVLGRNMPTDAAYRVYTATDLSDPRGSGADVSAAVMLGALSAHATDDGGGQIDGGPGMDTLVVFGRTNLSLTDLQNIERIVIGSDVTLTPEQLQGVTEITAGDGSILRLTGTGTTGLPVLRELRHIEVGAGVTLRVPDAAALQGVQVLSGTGHIMVEADDNMAFEDINLVNGLRITVNAGVPAAARTQTVGSADTVASTDPEYFGGISIAASIVLPSGGLAITGDANIGEPLIGTGNADRITLGQSDTATGNGGDDLYILPSAGTATITDFQAGDRLQLQGTTAAQIVSATVAADTLTILLAGNSQRIFTLSDVPEGELRVVDTGPQTVELFINQGPTALSTQTLRVNEDVAMGASAGMVDAVDPDGDSLIYNLIGGNDDNVFAIDPDSGEITVVQFLNHESEASRDLIVSITDGIETVTTTVTVEITDVNELQREPRIDRAGVVQENTVNTLLGIVSVADEDDPSTDFGRHAFTVDDDRFVVDMGQLRNREGLDHEAAGTIRVTVSATDISASPQPATLGTFIITVTDINEAPQTSGDQAFEVDEGRVYILSPADLSAIDEDLGDTPAQLTWRVTAMPANGRLALAAASGTAITSFTQVQLGAGEIIYIHDGGETRTDSFTMRVEDDASLAAPLVTVAVTVRPVNDAPSLGDASFTVPINSVDNTIVGTVTAIDADRPPDALSYSIIGGTAPATLFTINDAGDISISNSALLGDSGTVHTLNVQTDDGAGGTDSATVTVRIGGAALPPSAAASENVATDMTFELSFPGLSNGRITAATTAVAGITVTVSGSGTQLRVQAAADTLDHEAMSVLPITLTVTGDNVPAFTQILGLPVTDINEAPQTSGDLAISIAEGASRVLTIADLSATDEDTSDSPAQLTWQVVMAPSSGRLVLASFPTATITSFTQAQLISGQVIYIHDGSEGLTDRFSVQVRDDAGASANQQTVMVTVTAVDDPATAVMLTSTVTSFQENRDTATRIKIADISVTDPDGGLSALELTGLDENLFEFNAAQTELFLRSGTVLDFESNNQLDVSVRAIANPLATDSIVIRITNVNEAPTLASNQRFTVNERSSNGDTIGILNFNDPERGTLAFSITAGNSNNAFAINNNGQLTVADATQLDTSSIPSYALTIRIVDGPHTVEEDIMVTVVEMPQPPTALALSSTVVPQGDAAWVIGRLFATDPDGGSTPTFTWTPDDTVRFEVTGDFLKLRDGISLSSDTPVTVMATDAQDLTTQQTFTIRPLPIQNGMDSISVRDIDPNALQASSSGQVLRGLAGSDELNGGSGDDIIDGGMHDDVIIGGEGADVFVYRFDSSNGGLPTTWTGVDGVDRIGDYSPTDDKILFIDQNTGPNRVDTLDKFKSALGLDQNPNIALYIRSRDEIDSISLQFGASGQAQSQDSITGRHVLNIDFEDSIPVGSDGMPLFDTTTGTFNTADSLVVALGGADALLFG